MSYLRRRRCHRRCSTEAPQALSDRLTGLRVGPVEDLVDVVGLPDDVWEHRTVRVIQRHYLVREQQSITGGVGGATEAIRDSVLWPVARREDLKLDSVERHGLRLAQNRAT